jgi:hypothetical protein
VRDLDKAKDIFDENNTSGLTVAKCNLSSESEIGESLQGCDAAIWCATGFSDAQGPPFLEKIKRLVGIAGAPKTSIDAVGIPAVAKFSLRRSQLSKDCHVEFGWRHTSVVGCNEKG